MPTLQPKRKSPKRKSPKPKRKSPKKSEIDKKLNEQLRLFYEITSKKLSSKNNTLVLDHKKNRLCGIVSKSELENMPWMIRLNPNWSNVSEPYIFLITFKKVKGKIERYLSIKNISFLINDQLLDLEY